MDDVISQRLRRYLHEVKNLDNESAKTHRFVGLVAELFPGSGAATKIAEGTEKRVRIDLGDRTKTGRMDAYYGNAVVEFENSLRATEATALDQLREYTAGVWKTASGASRPLLCVASDGVTWKVFRPTVASTTKGKLQPSSIELTEMRVLVVSDETLSDFWIWLTSFLFRDAAHTEPSPDRFRTDFGSGSPAYVEAMAALRGAWEAASLHPESRLAFDTWKQYLAVTYGSPDRDVTSEPLFLRHTYLASVARLLVWASLSRGKMSGSLREKAAEVLSGDYFRGARIENVVEDDFFQWVRGPEPEPILAPVWERIIDQLLTYDLRILGQDVLKGVYQELVDPEERHELGEYYTPDWLCERIADETLPEAGFVSVLDPSCGSGSFLRAAISHMLAANPNGGPATRLRSVLDNVVGIDIHPLAVTIARATYLLAIRELIPSTRRPIQVPVYLADSLFLPAEVKQLTLGASPSYEIRFGGDRAVQVPEELVRAPELFDPAIAAGAEIAVSHAEEGCEGVETLRAYLERAVPSISEKPNADEMVAALWSFAAELADLIRRKQNSIWAFVVRNAYRPAMLREKFDLILGNPPWLSYRFISAPEYQEEVKRRAVDEYKIAPKSQKLITQMELATVFLAHSLAVYAKKGGRLAFVMPRSVLNADQHQSLRDRTYTAPVSVTRYWDLAGVSPVFNVPACVLFAERSSVQPSTGYVLDVEDWSGRLPARDVSWEVARDRVSADRKKARVIFLGNRTAISTRSGRSTPNDPSPYAASFHQGATIVPRNVYFVDAPHVVADSDPDALYRVKTEPEQAKEAKKPYKGIELSGDVEARFVFSTALSKHVLPFVVVGMPTVVLPVLPDSGGFDVLTSSDLKAAGYRHIGRWMKKAEDLWRERRGDKADKQTLYEGLDYHGKLSRQRLSDRYLVLYNHSGSNVCAAFLDRESAPLPFVVDVKLYWAACSSRAEGHYLAATLNSETVNQEIKPFQSFGLAGERDIHKKVLDLPIPAFDRKNELHQEISRLGAQAAREAEPFARSNKLPSTLGRRRAAVRDAIAPILESIDEAVQKLF